MTRWTEGPFLGFDTETTGVDPLNDRIVTAALVRRDASGDQVRNWLINPGVDIPEAASAIHGISTERASAEGMDPSVALEEIASAIAQAQLEGIPVVAFNAVYDLSILEAELARHGLKTIAQRIGHHCNPVIDPLVLDRNLDRFRRGKRTLGAMMTAYGVADQDDLHSADVDVTATLDVLMAMATRHTTIATVSLSDLHAEQVRAHRIWAEGFNAWRAKQGLEGPGADMSWPMLSELTAAAA